MKTFQSIILAVALAALAAGNAFAQQTGTWTGTNGATWNTTDTNWSGFVIADPWVAGGTKGFVSTAIFAGSGSANVSGAVWANKLNYTASSGTFTINGSTLSMASGEINVTNGGTLTINTSIANSLVSKNGAGNLNLTASNTFGGATYLAAGITTLSHNNALGTSGSVYTEGYGNNTGLRLSGGITVSGKTLYAGGNGLSLGQLNVNDGTTNTWAGAIRANGATRIGVSGTPNGRLNLGGNITQLNNPELQLMSQAADSTISVTGTITLSSSSTLRILAAGGNGVTRLGSTGNTLGLLKVDVGGKLIADVANTFDSAAVLQLGSSGNDVDATGSVDLNGYSQIVGGLRSGNLAAGETLSSNATRNITSATAATLTVNQTNNSLYDGTITGAIALTKNSAGTLTLSRTNTYTGATTVSAGTLALSGGGSLSTNSALNLSGATSRYDISAITASGITNASLAGVAGSVVNLGSKNLDIGADNTSTTFAGTITNTGSLTKRGTGTLTLSGANTYTGATTVSTGSLLINGDQSAATGVLSVASGATLGGSGIIGGATTISGNLQPGNSPGILTFSDGLTLESTAVTTMEINGTTLGSQYDRIDVVGSLIYGGRLTLSLGATFTEVGQYTFNLFDFSSSSGSFSTVELIGFYNGSLTNNSGVWGLNSGNDTWRFSQGDGLLTLDVVPEPSTYALLVLSAVGLAALMIRRRRLHLKACDIG